MTLGDCEGCYDNFYNDHNPHGIKRCWHFDPAKQLVARYRLHVDTPMNQLSGYHKVSVPPCFRMQRFVHLVEIPEYAK